MARDYLEILVPLTGGLNTAENPSQLEVNELQEMTGLEYRPPRTGIFATGGRTRYDVTAGGGTHFSGNNCYGLVFSQFDVSASGTNGSGQRLIAFSGTSAFAAVATGSTADFLTLKRDLTSAATAYAGGVHYANNWFYWNGVDNSFAVEGLRSMTATGAHGYFEVTGAITAVATAIAGTTADVGTYQIWMTEYRTEVGDYSDILSNGDSTPYLESAYNNATGIAEVTVSAAGVGISITYPAAQSNSDSFFRIYSTVADGKYPFGYVCAFGTGTSRAGNFDARANTHLGLTTWQSFGSNFSPVASALVANTPYAVVQPLGGVAVPQNSHPPKPFDYAVFQDSLVTIDVSDRQLIKYSEADKPHYFPSVNYIPFETEKQDKLTALEVCNNSLLVFSSLYGYRVDDLPRSTDGDDIFAGRGRAKEQFSHNHGAVGPNATAIFDIFGTGQLCLFACRDGIHITDGFKTDYATNNLDWSNVVYVAGLERCMLLNNPKKHRVEFYYPDAALSVPSIYYWQRLDFYYHPKFLKHGDGARAFPELPVGGPTPVPGPAATLGILNSDWRVWTASDTTFQSVNPVWMEGSGATDDSQLVDLNGTINKRFRTKDFYPAGTNGEFCMPHSYINQSATTASGSGTATLYARFDESATYTASATVDFSKTQAQPLRFSGSNVAPDNRMQAASVRVVKDDGGAWQELNYIVLVIDKTGKVKSAASNV